MISPIRLLKMPYVSMYMSDPDELVEGFRLFTKLLDKLDEVPITPRFTYESLKEDLIEFLVSPELDKEILTPDETLLYSSLPQISSSRNPDYGVEHIICSLGFDGWLRMANFNDHSPADEILLCNVQKAFDDGMLEITDECMLGECTTGGRRKSKGSRRGKSRRGKSRRGKSRRGKSTRRHHFRR